jgi:hypothetical protein
MMYLLRFKRNQDSYLFLTAGEFSAPWGLNGQLSKALRFDQLATLRSIIQEIQGIVFPDKPIDFTPHHFFLLRLYGYAWNDQVEGMMIEMHDVIKAQILDDNMVVVETHRLRNQTWDKHYI